MNQRVLPLRKQWLPLRVHPCGQVPFGGSGIASCAPSRGTQNEPEDVLAMRTGPARSDRLGLRQGLRQRE